MIICAGMMRTGLKTFYEALQLLGCRNIHDRESLFATYSKWERVFANKADPSLWHSLCAGRRSRTPVGGSTARN
jgi:hypothetical protein